MRPFTEGKFRALDNTGTPISGAKLYSYAAGTTTPQATYTTAALSVSNANPVVADSNGFASVWIDPTLTYRMVLKSADNGTTFWDVDNITDGGSLGSADIAFTGEGSGAVARTVEDRLFETLSVKDYGATGDGTTDDTAAIQLALVEAHTRTGTGKGVRVVFPGGVYRITSGLTITGDNITLEGEGRFSSTLLVAASGFTAVSFAASDGSTVFYSGMRNMGMRASVNQTAGTFIYTYNGSGLSFADMHLQGWYQGINNIGAARCFFQRISASQANRTSGQAPYFLKFCGDATAGICTGNHVSDIELVANNETVASPYKYGLLVTGSDGLYVHQYHATEGEYCAFVDPDNTTNNDLISSLIFSDCYFDVCTVGNVQLTGTCAATGKYRDIHFDNCIFRAGETFLLRAGSSSASSPIKALIVSDSTFRMSKAQAVSLTTDNVQGASISNCVFQGNNINADASGHDIIMRGSNVSVVGNTFLEGNATGNCIFIAATAQKVQVKDNDYTASTRTSTFNNTAASGGGYVIADNIETATTSTVERVVSATTTNATPATLWSHELSSDEAIALDVDVFAMDAAGAKGTHVRKIATYYKDGASAPALIGTQTTLHAVETDTGFDMVIDVSSNTVRVQITGLAATTVTWTGAIRAVLRSV